MKSIIVFAPHPDDEVLSCGGTIAKKIHEGYEVFIMFMTDGRYALTEVGETSSVDPLIMRDLRKQDAFDAAKILGLKEENLIFLDVEDKRLKQHSNIVLKKIIKLLNDVTPAEIYFPQKMEHNIDHQMTHIFINEALKYCKINSINYQYAIAWKPPFNIFANVLNANLFYSLMRNFLGSSLVCADVSRFLSIKRKAIFAYKSQLYLLSSNQKKVALNSFFLSKFLKPKEFFFVSAL